MTNLSTSLGTLSLKNPLVAVSGTFGYGFDYEPMIRPEEFGAVIVKGTSLKPWPGNPPQRIVETPAGMLNAIGLENPGVESFVRDYLPELRQRQIPCVVNVVGRTRDEYVEVAERLEAEAGIAALELNISCPNVSAGGMAFGTSAVEAQALVAAVRRVTRRPLMVKLSPNVTDITEIARAVEAGGADMISLINTLLGMEIDVQRGRPVLGNTLGGLSGPAIRPVALRCVWQVYQAVSLPILGLGGVASARDVLAFMMAGASAVGVGTALFSNPALLGVMLEELSQYRAVHGNHWPVGRAHEEGEPC